jgi:hypothetical protein
VCQLLEVEERANWKQCQLEGEELDSKVSELRFLLNKKLGDQGD